MDTEKKNQAPRLDAGTKAKNPRPHPHHSVSPERDVPFFCPAKELVTEDEVQILSVLRELKEEWRFHRDALRRLEPEINFEFVEKPLEVLTLEERVIRDRQEPLVSEWRERQQKQDALKQRWRVMDKKLTEANRFKWIKLGYRPPE
ncbi:hypothetical protein ACFLU6_07030 [Acidobacteriota bacterium]